MLKTEARGPSKRKGRVFAVSLLALLACGVLALSWIDINSPIPSFAELKSTNANGFRPNIIREVWGPQEYSIEFYDDAGRRYQVRGVSKDALDQITLALRSTTPVSIRYGRWRSPFPSSTIFSVYQVDIDGRVVIPYADLAEARHREQAAGPLIILCTALAAGFAVFMALWRQGRWKRQLALMKREDERKV